MEESVDHCLFCKDKIIPYFLTSQESDDKNMENESPLNFQKVCTALGIKITDEYLKQLSNVPKFCTNNNDCSGKTCETFLCLCCFEMVDTLTKLSNEAKKIEQKIASITSKIRSVIIKPSSTGAGASQRRTRPRRGCTGSLLGFHEAFQKLVKESEKSTTLSIIADDRDKEEHNPKQRVRPTRQAKEKSVKIDKVKVSVVQGSDHETGGVNVKTNNVKIEVDEREDGDAFEDLNDFEHFDDETESAIINTINFELKEDINEHDLKLCASVAEGQSEPKKVTRKRRNRINPNGEKDADSVAPPARKRRKGKSEKSTRELKFTCKICNAAFPTQCQYFAHRKKMHAPTMAAELKALENITTYFETENGKRVKFRVCSICDHKVKGRQLTGYMNHMLSHETTTDPSSPLHPCDMCDKQFMLKLNLDLHKICQHDWHHVSLTCEVCGDRSSKSQDELVTHLLSHGDGTTAHRCKSCPVARTSLDKLLVHMIRHSASKRLICPACTWFVTASVKELYQHCREAHPELKEAFKCEHCEKSFEKQSSLRNHLKQTHGIGDDDFFGTFFCSQCNNGKVYETKTSLERHLAYTHGNEESKHKCDQCEKSFTSKSHLQQHVENKHEKIRYPCPHCPKSYTERYTLNHHMRIHTGEGLETCDTCGKQFSTLTQLRLHSVVHLKVDEHTRCVCEVCGKEFPTKIHLQRHKNSSHKQKNLKCQYCEMIFGRRDHLRGHLRTHTGERPFTCPTCSKGFNRRDILLVHMKMHGYFSYEEASKAYDKHMEHLKQENFVA